MILNLPVLGEVMTSQTVCLAGKFRAWFVFEKKPLTVGKLPLFEMFVFSAHCFITWLISDWQVLKEQ